MRAGLFLAVSLGLFASDARASDVRASDEVRPATKTRVLLLDLQADRVDVDEVRAAQPFLATGLGAYPDLEVITSADLRKLVELEAERQMLDCSSTSCLAEIAGAYGARYVVFGDVGQLGETVVVNLNLYDSERAQPVAREVVRGERLASLVDELERAARRLGASISSSAPMGEAPPLALVGGGALAAVGAAGVVAGVAMISVAEWLASTPTTPGEQKAAAPGLVWGGIATLGAGALVGAVGAGLMTFALVE